MKPLEQTAPRNDPSADLGEPLKFSTLLREKFSVALALTFTAAQLCQAGGSELPPSTAASTTPPPLPNKQTSHHREFRAGLILEVEGLAKQWQEFDQIVKQSESQKLADPMLEQSEKRLRLRTVALTEILTPLVTALEQINDGGLPSYVTISVPSKSLDTLGGESLLKTVDQSSGTNSMMMVVAPLSISLSDLRAPVQWISTILADLPRNAGLGSAIADQLKDIRFGLDINRSSGIRLLSSTPSTEVSPPQDNKHQPK